MSSLSRKSVEETNLSDWRTTWVWICVVNQSVYLGVVTTMYGGGGDWGNGCGPRKLLTWLPCSLSKILEL